MNAKLAALLPFGKATDFLNEVLPVTAATNAATVRNRARRVGGRLLRDQAKAAKATWSTPSKTLVIGLDGGFVRSHRPLKVRNFEITAGKLLGENGECTRFAFATNEYERGVRQIRQGMEELGVNEETKITVLSDGDAGLRTVQWKVAPESQHILDWLHIGDALRASARCQQAIRKVPMVTHVSEWAHSVATPSKWALWNGQADNALMRLEELLRCRSEIQHRRCAGCDGGPRTYWVISLPIRTRYPIMVRTTRRKAHLDSMGGIGDQ